MKFLFAMIIALITYGSLYPFDFSLSQLSNEKMYHFLYSFKKLSGKGDILSNIILFVPYGFIGFFIVDSRRNVYLRLSLVVLSGIIFSAALQAGQLLLSRRDPLLQDVIWNTMGILVGVGIAFPQKTLEIVERIRKDISFSIPVLLIGSWVAVQLFPFVPTIDLQSFKNNLKPFLLHPLLSHHEVIKHAVAWMVAAVIWNSADKKSTRYLPLVILVTLGLQISIIQNGLNISEFTGAVLALIIWQLLRRIPSRTVVVLCMLVVMMTTQRLSPWVLRKTPAAFNWIPFSGFLEGSMFVNARILCEKFFLFGSLLWLLRDTGLGMRTATSFSVIWAVIVEIVQTRVGHHTPEITDPLYILLIAFIFWHKRGTAMPIIPKSKSHNVSLSKGKIGKE